MTILKIFTRHRWIGGLRRWMTKHARGQQLALEHFRKYHWYFAQESTDTRPLFAYSSPLVEHGTRTMTCTELVTDPVRGRLRWRTKTGGRKALSSFSYHERTALHLEDSRDSSSGSGVCDCTLRRVPQPYVTVRASIAACLLLLASWPCPRRRCFFILRWY
jgi:hypothetical protein